MRSKNSSSHVTFRPVSPVERSRSGATKRFIAPLDASETEGTERGPMPCRLDDETALAVSLPGPARGQNGSNELLRNLRGNGCVVVGEGALAELHRLCIAREVPLAIDTHPHV